MPCPSLIKNPRIGDVMFKAPPKGNMWFWDPVEYKGQTRGIWFSAWALVITLIAALMAEFIPPQFGLRPYSWIWMFPAIALDLLILFWISRYTLDATEDHRRQAQVTFAIGAFIVFAGMIYWLGGSPWSAKPWLAVLQNSQDKRDLAVAAFVLSVALGYFINPKLWVRGLMISLILLFMANWMDLQGYYTVYVNADFSQALRSDVVPSKDRGLNFAAMTIGVIASWVPLMVWARIKSPKT